MLAKTLRAVPAPKPARFMAFADDEATRAAVLLAAEQIGAGEPVLVAGGVAEARMTLATIPTPEFLIVDLGGETEPVPALAGLADVCDEGTRLVALGDVNDVDLYRELIAFGVQDYLLKPVSAEALAAALARADRTAEAPPEEAKLGRLVAVVGVRGGVGASTVAVNTAWMMAHEQGLRVALVDLDLYFGTCALALDLEPGRGFREALENPGRIDGLFIERAMVRESDNLFVLGAEESFENPFSFDPAALDLLLDNLRHDFGCVVLDLPRFAARTQIANLTPPAELVVVSDPSLAGMRDTMRLTGFVKKTSPQLAVRVAVNRVGTVKTGELTKPEFEKGAETKVDYLIPHDPKPIAASAASGKPLAKVGKSAKIVSSLRALSRAVAGAHGRAEAKTPAWRRILAGAR